MKNLFYLIVFLFLSCNEKKPERLTSELIAKTENSVIASNSSNTNSDLSRTVLYKGTLNETIKIWLYLNEQEHPCGGDSTILNVMYKYENQQKWLLLNATADKEKKNYCMVEDHFSGVLFLEENENSLNGKWISPDTSKQLKVRLQKVALDKETNEILEETLFDDLIFSKNDC